ncbi:MULTISPECIES: hypothetical protein [Vibrio]|jgi:hypothetical protein|uniref:hypothetical protein n=1 Tax=Vibrio TaxID=662 RepID=UPI0002DB40D6|nr:MULTISPECIES: hypothetical protein [Vibrio]MDN4693356.1 hypothetical protein [Vibrio parahaemolyticus]APP05801.1 hypothetical protein BG259_10875 [Vibrio harveyi]APP06157.1 hypothetical protein BG259_12970 [Vibrio harveyi]EKO3836793.1 hypothetical protein [Vibrio harveyi]EKO3864540.1 hypothetical protein [Vibrio harveyi]
MKTLSIDDCQRDLAALDAADQLTASLKKQIASLKGMDSKSIMKTAMPMLMSGNISLEGLGLPVNLFEQIEQLEQINSVGRAKLRARITADLHALNGIEEAEVSHG